MIIGVDVISSIKFVLSRPLPTNWLFPFLFSPVGGVPAWRNHARGNVLCDSTDAASGPVGQAAQREADGGQSSRRHYLSRCNVRMAAAGGTVGDEASGSRIRDTVRRSEPNGDNQ